MRPRPLLGLLYPPVVENRELDDNGFAGRPRTTIVPNLRKDESNRVGAHKFELRRAEPRLEKSVDVLNGSVEKYVLPWSARHPDLPAEALNLRARLAIPRREVSPRGDRILSSGKRDVMGPDLAERRTFVLRMPDDGGDER